MPIRHLKNLKRALMAALKNVFVDPVIKLELKS